MGRRIVYSPDSRRDYEEIYLYIAADNPAAAEKLPRTFDEKLQTQPYAGWLNKEA
jgi:plasmid stabilization system protein ParE